jgi:hypothetical protein
MEAAVAVAEEDADGAVVEIGGDQVGVAVTVEVGGAKAFVGSVAGGEELAGNLEAAGSIADEKLDLIVSPTIGDHIGMSVSIEVGDGDAVGMRVGVNVGGGGGSGWKLPLPSPSRTVIVGAWWLGMTRSRLPSPFMSAMPMSLGSCPQAKGEPGAGRKCPEPSPRRTLRVPLSALVTRMSGLLSRLMSATAIQRGPRPTGMVCSWKRGASPERDVSSRRNVEGRRPRIAGTSDGYLVIVTRLVGVRGFPPLRQKESAKMGHGDLYGNDHDSVGFVVPQVSGSRSFDSAQDRLWGTHPSC